MFSSAFVCLLAGLAKSARPSFTKFGGRVAYGQRKKPLYFVGNLDNVMLGLEWDNRWKHRHISDGRIRVTLRSFNSNNFWDISGLGKGVTSTECHSSCNCCSKELHVCAADRRAQLDDSRGRRTTREDGETVSGSRHTVSPAFSAYSV